MAINNLKLM